MFIDEINNETHIETSNENMPSDIKQESDNTFLTSNEETSEETTKDFNFREVLSDEYKEKYPEFKTVEDFVKGYDQLAKKLGKPLSPPDEKASNEEWAKYYKKIGRPESPDEYDFELSENTHIQDDYLEEFKQAAFKAGMNKKQANEFLKWQDDKTQEIISQVQEKKAKAQDDLKKLWGKKFQEKTNEVMAFAETLSEEGYKDIILDYGNDPAFISLLANIKDHYVGEDSNRFTNLQRFNSVESLKEEIDKARKSDKFRTDPAHRNYVEDLYKELHRRTG